MVPMASSLVDGFFRSSFMGQAIVMLQVMGSVVMLAIALGKWKSINKERTLLRRVGRDVMMGQDVLEYHLARRQNEGSAIEHVYAACCDRLLKLLTPTARTGLIRGASDLGPSVMLTPREVGLVQAICDHTLDEEEIRFESGMSWIATIVALAPMLGLLGTVWGVLDAFADMGATGTATIATMAPAISSALVTTVVGLLVAFPGIIFDSRLRDSIRQLQSDLEGFSDDLMGRIRLEMQGGAA